MVGLCRARLSAQPPAMPSFPRARSQGWQKGRLRLETCPELRSAGSGRLVRRRAAMSGHREAYATVGGLHGGGSGGARGCRACGLG